MMNRHPMRMVLGATALVTLSLLTSGCAPQAKPATMTAALDSYQAADYSEAHQQAASIMSTAKGQQREEAAYVAGLSAYRGGDADAAESNLSAAAVSSDPLIAGSAKAMLGQLRLDQHRSREAAAFFVEAANTLSGEDSARAAWHAGLAYRQMGDETSAKHWLAVASRGGGTSAPVSSRSPTVASTAVASSAVMGAPAARPPGSAGNTLAAKPATIQQPQSVGFTLQVGAFTDKKRAKKAAEDAQQLAQNQSLGRVRVIPRKDARGQTLYMVQVGWWVSRSEATAARARVGRLEYIVTPAAPLT